MEVSGQHQAPASLSLGKIHRYALNRARRGLQSYFEPIRGEKNLLPLPQFELRNAQIVAWSLQLGHCSLVTAAWSL